MDDPSDTGRKPCDTPLGLNVPRATHDRLKRLALEVQERGRKATMQDVLVHLIDSADAEMMCQAFPQRKQSKRT